jgi:hypothetical protein
MHGETVISTPVFADIQPTIPRVKGTHFPRLKLSVRRAVHKPPSNYMAKEYVEPVLYYPTPFHGVNTDKFTATVNFTTLYTKAEFSLRVNSKLFVAVREHCFSFHHSSFNHSLLNHHENISYKCED